jgi:hypothetical protein
VLLLELGAVLVREMAVIIPMAQAQAQQIVVLAAVVEQVEVPQLEEMALVVLLFFLYQQQIILEQQQAHQQ